MLRRASAVALLALASSFFVPACSSDDAPLAQTMELYPTTKVLDADALGRITDVSADTTTVTFGTTSPVVDGVVVGDIVLGGIAGKTPNGILRRVTAVTRTGAGVTWTTSTAALADAIKRGAIKLPRRVLSATSARAEVQEGVHAQALPGGVLAGQSLGLRDDGIASGSLKQDFTLGIDKWEVIKGVEASGSVGFGLGVDLDLTINPGEVSGALTLIGSETATLDVLAKYAKKFDKSKELAAYYFPPIPIDILGVPMVIVLKLSVDVGTHGYTSTKLTWSGKENAQIEVGASIGTNGLTPIYEGTASASADPPLVSGSLDVKATVGLKLEASINAGFADAALWAGADGFVGLQGNTADDPCWKLHTGLDARLGASAHLLFGALKLVDEQIRPNLVDELVTSGSCGLDATPVTPWSTVLAPTKLDDLPSIALLPDQTILLGARTSGSTSYSARLDADGASIWERKYDGQVQIDDVLASPDGTSWIAGRTGNILGFARLDDDGVATLAKSLSAPSGTGLTDVHFAPSRTGGILLGGTVDVTGGGFVAKLDPNGAVVWANVYPTIGTPYAISEASDGGVVLFGTVPIAGGAKSSVLKTTPTGAVAFAKSFGEGRFFGGTSLAKGGMVATGATNSGGQAMVVRIGDDGTKTWGFAYGPNGADTRENRGNAVSERSDGVLVAGNHGFASAADGWAMLVAPDGSLAWSRAYGSADEDDFVRVRTTADNGAVLVGTSYGFGDIAHLFVNRIPPLGALSYSSAVMQQTNVDGVALALPGSEVALVPTVTPLALVVSDGGLASWSSTPITAPRTPLAP